MTECVAIEPRKGRGSRRLTYGLTDFYREYKKECKLQYGAGFTKKMMSRKVFMSVMKDYFLEVAENIVNDRTSAVLPKRMGKLGVHKHKCVNPEEKIKYIKSKIDKIHPDKMDKTSYFWRTHFVDHFFAWKWYKTSARGTIKYLSWYSFTPTRVIKRMLSDHIYACAQNPMVKDYDVTNEQRRRVSNPIELPGL